MASSNNALLNLIHQDIHVLIEQQKQSLLLLQRIAESSEKTTATLQKFYEDFSRPNHPGVLSATVREVNNMAFVADVTLPDWDALKAVDPDIQFGTIYCDIDGSLTTHRVEVGSTTFTSPEGPEGATCTLQMTTTDDAKPDGLESAKSPELKLLFADVQPPSAPPALTAVVREV